MRIKGSLWVTCLVAASVVINFFCGGQEWVGASDPSSKAPGTSIVKDSDKAEQGMEAVPMTLGFSENSRKELISAVIDAVRAAVNGKKVSHDAVENIELQVKAGCFVTLKNHGRLRGCIGRFTSGDPLLKTAREMAVASATLDERFRHDPITPAEVDQLEVEISVLSPLRRVSDPMKEIELGRDGILIRDKGRSGTFLPQVATETKWSLEEFLGHCSRDKAMLGWDGWKSPSAEVFAYTVTILGEQ
jgi:AmmeMemoRadiSam system protein A